ncbi:unnamed protein product [Hyaloperonospora brassicae]|uniref:RxLR effector protein n=1 Tax=Hyaloperonospora brassicae TaxID=162125 RepID=A0AAV0T6P6_HYABA|nr:unnamed protein product [Hyaloperonospora brassicae]
MRRLCFDVLLAAVLFLVADVTTAALTVRRHETTNSTSLDSSDRTRALATEAKSDPTKSALREEEEEEEDAVDGASEERFGFIRSWVTRAIDKVVKLATYYKWIYSGKKPDDIKVFPGKTSHTGYYDFYFKRTHKHGDYVWN